MEPVEENEKLKDMDIGEHPVPTRTPSPEPAPSLKNEVRKLMHSGRRIPTVRSSIVTDRAAAVRARLRAKLLRKKEKKTPVKTGDGLTSHNSVEENPSSRYQFRRKYSEIPKLIVQKYELYKQLKDLRSYLVEAQEAAKQKPIKKVKFQEVKTEEKVRLRQEFENWLGNKHVAPKIEPISEDESEAQKPLSISEIKVEEEKFKSEIILKTEKEEMQQDKDEQSNIQINEEKKIKQEDQTKSNETSDQNEMSVPCQQQQQQNNEVSDNNDTHHFSSQLPTIKEEVIEVMDMQNPIFEEIVQDGALVEENEQIFPQQEVQNNRPNIYAQNFQYIPNYPPLMNRNELNDRVYESLEEFFEERIRMYSPLIETCLATMEQEEFDEFLWHAFMPPNSLLAGNIAPTVHLYWDPPSNNNEVLHNGFENGNGVGNAEIREGRRRNNENIVIEYIDEHEENIDIENTDDDKENIEIEDSEDDKENIEIEDSEDDKENTDTKNSDDDKENTDMGNSDDDKENTDMENSDDDKENIDTENSVFENENENVENENVRNGNVENENVENENVRNGNVENVENIENENVGNEIVRNENIGNANAGNDNVGNENVDNERPEINLNPQIGNNYINDLYRINIRAHEVQPPRERYANNMFNPYAPPYWFNALDYPEHLIPPHNHFEFGERIFIGSQIINEEFNAYIRYIRRNNE